MQDPSPLPALAHSLYHSEKSFTLFDDVPHLFDIKINKRAIICLLSVIKQPVIVLAPFDGQLLSLDIVSMKNRSNLAVLSKGPPGPLSTLLKKNGSRRNRHPSRNSGAVLRTGSPWLMQDPALPSQANRRRFLADSLDDCSISKDFRIDREPCKGATLPLFL